MGYLTTKHIFTTYAENENNKLVTNSVLVSYHGDIEISYRLQLFVVLMIVL